MSWIDGQALCGTVQEVLAPQVLPGGKQEKPDGTKVEGKISAALYTPVRISIEPGDKALPLPGTQAKGVVFTRNIWGFYGF